MQIILISDRLARARSVHMSLRHLVGGGIDRLSEVPMRRNAYRCVSCLNRRHMGWAWPSLVWVAFADLYVRLCASGVWTDWRLL